MGSMLGGGVVKRAVASHAEHEVTATVGGGDRALAAGLSLDEVCRLCQALAVELGLTPAGRQMFGSHVDLTFTSTVLLRQRRVLIRVSIDQPSVEGANSLAHAAADQGCADFLLVCTRPATDDLAESEHLLGPDAFIQMCRGSALVEWRDRVPRVRRSAYESFRQRTAVLSELDAFGLAWLPALSRDRLPWALRESAIPANEWFERIVFRVATAVFRINGHRLGSASRGQRVGDALLWSNGHLALLDCKAAYSGYQLGVDDERRLLEYAEQRHPGYCDGEAIECVVLVSSEFPTFDTKPRRFEARRSKFRSVGSDLACLRVDDLIDAALMILAAGDDTRRAESIRWRVALSEGMVSRESLLGLCAEAIGRY